MMEPDKIICGDNVAVLRGLPDTCVDLTVTSPPYDNLRTYNGYTWNFEALARELYRVTKPGGVVVWVVGDATIDGSETGTSFRQALYFMGIGFNLHDTMIYKKVAGATGSNYAYWQAFEYMFVFSNGFPKSINLLHDRKNIELPGIIKKAAGHRHTNGEKKYRRIQKRKVYGKRFNVWELHTADITEFTNHPAQFPEALARDHILSWSNPGDLVLDPFIGSGTTAKMAKETGRHWLGIDISDEYCKLAEKRVRGANVPLFV